MAKQNPFTVYLAGPISNCNQRQRTEWRKRLKTQLEPFGWVCIDPADHLNDWTPSTEMAEIAKSDVVIANLWRESIGTVVGIVQARRKGKPVILIDPNYLDSANLEAVVGNQWIVHSVKAAVTKLQGDIVRQLEPRGSPKTGHRGSLQNRPTINR